MKEAIRKQNLGDEFYAAWRSVTLLNCQTRLAIRMHRSPGRELNPG